MKPVKTGDAIKMLKKAGFVLENQVGSHMKYSRGNDKFTLVYHSKDSEELGRKACKQLLNLLK